MHGATYATFLPQAALCLPAIMEIRLGIQGLIFMKKAMFIFRLNINFSDIPVENNEICRNIRCRSSVYFPAILAFSLQIKKKFEAFFPNHY
jgi:hypothetical protein